MQSCILCPIQGCLICSQSTTCLKCMSGYSLNSAGSCSVCLAPCATCNGSAYNCLTCLYPFSQVASSNGTCFTCNVQNCLSCSRNSPYTCSQCLSNYSLINNTCYFNGPCSINCVSCLLNQICLLCSTGYTVSPYISTQCIQCNIKHCHTCSPTDTSTCLVCSSGFY
jgi:proprotein convertase subtilisin/kexin type 5